MEGLERLADAVVESWNGALLGFTQLSLELGEALFDRIEIGAVGRQVNQAGPCGFDDVAHLIAFVGRQIIDDDDIAGPQRGYQALLQVFDEDRPVHGAVDNERCGEAIQPEPGHKGHGLPVSPGNAANNPTTAFGPAVEPRHFGRGSGLIDEDQLGWIEVWLIDLPFGAGFGHVRPLLLGRPRAFF